MNSIQISRRLLSSLSLGKTTCIILKPVPYYYHYGQYIARIRWFYSSSILFNEQSRTVTLLEKVEVNGRKLKQILTSSRKTSIVDSNTSLTTISSSKQMSSKCQSLYQRIIHELKHYYNGFKLLFIETKIAFRLLHQVLNGHKLTRRERKQFIRTVVDLIRLVPFSVFIIVPFMEFTLPIFLKLFPNMLPSTFKQTDKELENFKKQSKIRLELARVLQDTLEDAILKSRKRCSLDTLTLDNLDRSQLIALCKLLNLSFIGPNYYLRCKLQLKLHRLKIDDRLIANEGIENLDTGELQAACYERGMNSFNLSMEHLQSQLQQWLDLHINKCLPVTILLSSHGFYLSENIHNTTITAVIDKRDAVEDQIIKKQVVVSEKEFLMYNQHIDIDQFQMGLEQFVNQTAVEEIQEFRTDLKEYREDIKKYQTFTAIEQLRYLTDTRSVKIHSKCLDKVVVQLTQTSDEDKKYVNVQ